jgi:hypothetical protein
MRLGSVSLLALAAVFACKDGATALTAEQQAKLPIVVYYSLPG